MNTRTLIMRTRVAVTAIAMSLGLAVGAALPASATNYYNAPISGADEVNLTPAATNCGNGVSYLPADGQAMTAADFASLGMQVPPNGSPLTKPGTRWIAPRCAQLPAGQHPGGPAVRSTSPVSSQVGVRSAAASVQMGGSANWTGFQSNGGGPYSDAYTEWTIPSSFPTPPGNTYESSWAGIGSGASDSNALFQAGTETNVNTGDGVTNYAWWEFYPENTQQKLTNLSIRSGSHDYALVSHTGYGKGEAEVCTEPPGQSSFTCTAIDVTWGTAYTIGSSQFECIAERTQVGDDYPRLTDITGVQFYNCEGYTNSWQAIGNINRYYFWMAKTQTASQCRTAPWAAETGSIYNSDDFAINWYGYGWPIPAADC